ncbi:hypothetical protein [Pseudobacteriovorax antillogorgiicola]|uniref:Uncharacterized protein n=1 Tax=Pseudobacteriovorax antillogorgiicola TaxID=1513793 RepID=A0A1Y6C8N5_9BACT|nr:hypothetical protein [Pseudobacteriovorax antillogorgiicola]TCS49105.1 hypothetical protein EDD56_116148 [Pseudobacteriovorax antillogorgiicola]SMF51676.1 hypothetical protein SAMN06296036_1166 [Pseudobacteriovorax antillogorgiicola]
MRLNRRQLAKLGGATSIATLAPQTILGNREELPRFLITLTCTGGASLNDSFLALRESDVDKAGGDPATLNCFPEQNIKTLDNLPFAAVNQKTIISNLGDLPVKTDQIDFLKKYGHDLTVITCEGSSVNHEVAQHRSLTGNNAWNGRTLMEAVAAEYGSAFIMPYINLATGGYAEPGIDPTTPNYARAIQVTEPLSFALSLHSQKQIERLPSKELIDAARQTRRLLEEDSPVAQQQARNPMVKNWKTWRSQVLSSYEEADLINAFDILNKDHPQAELIWNTFPRIGIDPFDSQAAIAYLALSRGISNVVSLGPSFQSTIIKLGEIYNPPIAFDFSHQDHRAVQAFMWDRMLRVAGKLIDLLSLIELGSSGKSMWDRTMIYFASDFGRDKIRSGGSEKFGSGHNLNNGFVFLSPMFRGGRVLGGIDPKTALTYGFDLETGRPQPGRTTTEEEVFATLLHVMGIKPAGLPRIGFA